MPDLADRIRDYVDAAQPSVTMDEVLEALNRHQLGAKPVSMPRRRLLMTLVAVLLVAAVVVPIFVIGNGSENGTEKGTEVLKPTEPRLRLVVDTQQPAWQVQGQANPVSYSLVCPTKSNCYATGPSSTSNTDPSGIVQVSKDGGQSWHTSLIAGAGSGLYGLTCPSPLTCMIGGEDFETGNLGVTMFSTNDGGSTWTHQAIPGASLGSSLLSCSSVTQCVATMSQPGPGGRGEQDEAIVTSDGGVHWVDVPFPGTFRPYALQCMQGGRCVAVGQSPTNFIVLGGDSIHGSGTALFSDDGGISWQQGQIPTADTLTSLSCADSLHCMAVEATDTLAGNPKLVSGPFIDSFISTRDGGKTWTATPGNEPEQWILGVISCPTALQCTAAGALHPPGATPSTFTQTKLEGFVLATDNGGQTWNSVELPQFNRTPITTVTSLSCPESKTCFALAYDPTSAATRGQERHQLVLVSRTQPS